MTNGNQLAHHWNVKFYQTGIFKKTCYCGATLFTAEDGEEELQARVKFLNRRSGKEGTKPHPWENGAAGVSQTGSVSVALSQGDKEMDNRVPPRPKSRKAWPGYYAENKEAIIRDYQTLTVRKFLTKWHIQTLRWAKLMKEWNVPGKFKRPREKLIKPGVPVKGEKDQLPAFPAFREEWDSQTKVGWFDAFVRLKELGELVSTGDVGKGVLQGICAALNILVWKVPSSPEWPPANWAAELQDKNIIVAWDKDREKFIPGVQR
ncbi:MAG: hypothetical protein Q8O55_01520 [Dehalococcoidales bacterium]|nr:hypothetical protein [Dehalococcoidales bacterium]